MRHGFAAAAVTLAAAAAAPATLTVRANHADALYAAGEPVVWTVTRDGADEAEATVDYVVKRDGLTPISHGTLDLSRGPATVRADLDAPGALLLVLTPPGRRPSTNPAVEMSGVDKGGAIVAGDRIAPAEPPPADFEAFWAAQRADLARVPIAPELTPGPSGTSGVDYWTVRLGNVGGSHVYGQLARPTGHARRPALLMLQWAGVYGLDKAWVTSWAARGWLTLDIEPHDLPGDRPKAFYAEQAAGPLRDYSTIGNDHPARSYFRRMYLSCVRAVDFLETRDDWDGRTMVVTGDSQGGLQTLMVAGLDPRVTAAAALVPAGCDQNGPLVGRAPGWPQWTLHPAGHDPAAVRRAAAYYDVANFTPRIRCPVLVGVGAVDTTCPPAGVLAAYNEVPGPKRLAVLPASGHQDHAGSQASYRDRRDAWFTSILDGRPTLPD